MLYEVNATPFDFFFFVSREFNQRSEVEDVIHNYALMYALSQTQHILAINHTPNYDELKNLDFYATPARPEVIPTKISIQYNSINEFTGKTESLLNIPSIGRYSMVPPLSTTFIFYLLTKEKFLMKPIVRIGKKSLPFKLEYSPLKISKTVEDPEGFIKSSCIVNVLDLLKTDTIRQGILIYMPPTPLLVDAEIKTPHIVAEKNGETIFIPIPSHFRG